MDRPSSKDDVPILDRPCIEKNTHIGCVLTRNGPKAFVSFLEDLSPEANQPTDEMVRLVADHIQGYISRCPLHFAPRKKFDSDDAYIGHLYDRFMCLPSADGLLQHMRTTQVITALRQLFCPDD